MRRIYRGLARRQAFLVKRTKTAIVRVETREHIVALVGIATFFFGFGAGALLNLYLLAINHPLVHQFRAALTYKSTIIGDGILLPIVNMIAVSFILNRSVFIGKRMLQLALLVGASVTIYFHVDQAAQGLVNWAMPQPWHWNILGLWHAIYMFSVASLLSLFYLVSVKVMKEEKEVSLQILLVTLGLAFFFFLLRLDYINVSYSTLIPGR